MLPWGNDYGDDVDVETLARLSQAGLQQGEGPCSLGEEVDGASRGGGRAFPTGIASLPCCAGDPALRDALPQGFLTALFTACGQEGWSNCVLILSHTLAFPCIFQCSLSLEIIKIHPDTILSSVAPLPVCSEGQHQSLALAGNEWTKLEEHLHFDPS